MDVLGALKSLATKIKHLTVDDAIFRLHYRLTFVILLAFSILVTSKQYIGDPIDCAQSGTNIREDLIDTYCWISSTITVPHACHKKVGTEVISPCVEKNLPGNKVVYHQYYQWVCFVLFLQALMFYLPHYVWKSWEGGRLKALTQDLDGPLVGSQVKEQRIHALTAYFNVSLYRHNFYAYRYAICEYLNFVNVVGQMFITDRFLGGTFLTYGTEVIKFNEIDQFNRTDPMAIVFPRVTKCTFNIYGAGGNAQNVDTVCILPINIINEKIYIVLWFWFIILAILSGLAIFFRLATIFSSDLRYRLLRMNANAVDNRIIDNISYNIGFGDWFMLHLLSKNINSYIFRDVADVVLKQIENPDSIEKNPKVDYKKKFPF